MKNLHFGISQISLSRIPKLYYGSSSSDRNMTGREKLAEKIFVSLQIISHILFLVGGIIGYSFYQLYGLLLFAVLGHLIGVWIRRSMGIRGLKPTTGFFMRMRERAHGSKPGLLEGLLEILSHNEFTPDKCRSVIQIYDKAVKQLKQSGSVEEQTRILADLDKRVNQILYQK